MLPHLLPCAMSAKYHAVMHRIQELMGHVSCTFQLHYIPNLLHCITLVCDVILLTLASALRWNTILSELRLEQCAINAKGMTDIAQALCGIPTLKVLNLEGNQLNYVAARQLGKLFYLILHML